LVNYRPEIGVVLNIDKDHKELDELYTIFQTFVNQSRTVVVNEDNASAARFSQASENNFSASINSDAATKASQFIQTGFEISFQVESTSFSLHTIGRHNMENALAAIAVAKQLSIPLSLCAKALVNYKGIYRRMQVIGKKNGVWLIDDYAHNPVKCAAAIRACQPLTQKVIAWFQPHGFGPTKFLKNEFIQELAAALRPNDELWMSSIYYAGGTTDKSISANDIVVGIQKEGKKAFYLPNRKELLSQIKADLKEGDVILMMGARDPSLAEFVQEIWEEL